MSIRPLRGQLFNNLSEVLKPLMCGPSVYNHPWLFLPEAWSPHLWMPCSSHTPGLCSSHGPIILNIFLLPVWMFLSSLCEPGLEGCSPPSYQENSRNHGVYNSEAVLLVFDHLTSQGPFTLFKTGLLLDTFLPGLLTTSSTHRILFLFPLTLCLEVPTDPWTSLLSRAQEG